MLTKFKVTYFEMGWLNGGSIGDEVVTTFYDTLAEAQQAWTFEDSVYVFETPEVAFARLAEAAAESRDDELALEKLRNEWGYSTLVCVSISDAGTDDEDFDFAYFIEEIVVNSGAVN